MENILEFLDSKSICYSVCKSLPDFSCSAMDKKDDWFITCIKKDVCDIVDLKDVLENCDDNKRLSLISMEKNDVKAFKAKIKNYDHVESFMCGDVFELKDNSFRARYNLMFN